MEIFRKGEKLPFFSLPILRGKQRVFAEIHGNNREKSSVDAAARLVMFGDVWDVVGDCGEK